MAFRFIHCADIHLGVYSQIPARYEDFFKILEDIFDFAIVEKVDAVLIAGDFFHHRAIDALTLSKATNLLKKLREQRIDVIAIEGNHDKAYYLDKQSWMQFLQQQRLLTLLSPQQHDGQWIVRPNSGIFENELVRIIGFGYLGGASKIKLTSLAESLPEKTKPTIALLHAGVNRLMAQDLAGIAKADLELLKDKIDYLALGHIHNRYEIDEWVFNPGAPEAVHIDEAKGGEKGYYLVSIDEDQMQVEFIESNRRKVTFLRVENQQTTPDQLKENIYAQLPRDAEGSVLKIEIWNQSDFLSSQIDWRALENLICSEYGFLMVEIVNHMQITQSKNSWQHLDREQMELEVFQTLAKENGFEVQLQMAQTVRALKNALLTGETSENLIAYLQEKAEEVYADSMG